jgi:hypothetical protein
MSAQELQDAVHGTCGRESLVRRSPGPSWEGRSRGGTRGRRRGVAACRTFHRESDQLIGPRPAPRQRALRASRLMPPFALPHAPAKAHKRESIEVRCLIVSE